MSAFALSLAYVLLALVLIILAKWVLNLATPFHLDEQLTEEDNPALGLSLVGYIVGVVIVYLGAAMGPELDVESGLTMELLLWDFGAIAAWTVAGMVGLNIGQLVLDKVALRQFSTVKEIITDRNVGTGAVEFGNFVATAFIVAGAINGQGGGPLTALVFFVLGQVALVLFSLVYELVTPYSIHEQIEADNVAAGVAFGGNLIALGLILFNATKGDFVSWQDNLIDFGMYSVFGFAVLLVLHFVTDHMLLPKSTLHHEIAVDRNVASAWLEASIAISMAAIVVFML